MTKPTEKEVADFVWTEQMDLLDAFLKIPKDYVKANENKDGLLGPVYQEIIVTAAVNLVVIVNRQFEQSLQDLHTNIDKANAAIEATGIEGRRTH